MSDFETQPVGTVERLQSRIELLEGVAQMVVDTKQICQFETRLQGAAREALAAVEDKT